MNIAFFSMALIVLLGFAGYATDGGMIWISRTRLQNSVDAAVLAAAQELPAANGTTQTAVRGVACDYAAVRNPVPGMFGKTGTCSNQADVTFPDSTTIRVKAYRTVQPIFGQIVGFSDTEVSATAKAVIGSPAKSGCYFPLTQYRDMLDNVRDANGIRFDPPVATLLKADPSSGEPLPLGVYGSNSSSAWQTVIGSEQGCDGSSLNIGDPLDIKNGAFAGPLRNGLADRSDLWKAQGNCVQPNPGAAPYTVKPDGTVWRDSLMLDTKNCYRMVLIPVANSLNSKRVVAFALFWIAGWCGQGQNPTCRTDRNTTATPPAGLNVPSNGVWGYYVGVAVAGGQDYQNYDGYGVKIVALAE